jgi:hypothetical protein
VVVEAEPGNLLSRLKGGSDRRSLYDGQGWFGKLLRALERIVSLQLCGCDYAIMAHQTREAGQGARAMAARDVYHKAVKEALIKDQWHMTDDPLVLQVGGVDMYVDLGAERLLAAEKDQQQIAVEVKSFLGPSLVNDFHLALGQFLNYRLALAQRDPDRRLYLAVPIETYTTFFALPFIQSAVQQYQLALLVYNAELQEVIKWID